MTFPAILTLSAVFFAADLAPRTAIRSVTINPQDRTVLMGAFANATAGLSVVDLGPGKVGWVEGWRDSSASLTWTVRIPSTAKYLLSVVVQGPEPNGQLTIQAAGRSATVSCGRDWDRVKAGLFAFAEGEQSIVVRSTGHSAIRKLFSVELVRPEAAAAMTREAASLNADTSSFVAGRYGLMFHWTSETKPRSGPPKPYQQAVRDFDVERFAKTVQLTGARHVVFTTSHAGFYFPGPNEIIDSILPGRTCERDLIGDLADALSKRGIKLWLYYHPGHDDAPWWNRTHFAEDKSAFFRQWCDIVSSIGSRYGRRIAGFWFDDAMFTYYPFNAPWQAMTQAAKTGNPDRLVIYNSWILPRVSDFYEVFAGENSFSEEVITGNGYLPAGGSGMFVGGPQAGLQGNITTILEGDWGHFATDTPIAPLKYSSATMLTRIRECIARKNVPTFDLEIYQDGTVAPEALSLFRTIQADLDRDARR